MRPVIGEYAAGCWSLKPMAAGQMAAKMLYRVSPFDPIALVGAAVVLAATVLLACYLPARRATKINPAITLRSE